MKITLINPPFLFPIENQFAYSQCLGLRSISSFLKSRGNHKIDFIDALFLGFSNVKKYARGFKIIGLEFNDIVKRIPENTEMIGLSVPFSQYAPIAHDIIDCIRARFPETLIIMGGVYPSTQPQLALTSKADLIIVGEGERSMMELAEGKSAHEIIGVYSKESLKMQSFPSSQQIDDLDTLPLPDYSIPSIEDYFSLSPRLARGKTASIITSRGCPFACEFCSIHPIYGKRYRSYSSSRVLEEIKFLVEKYSITSLEIEDDNFTLKKGRTVEILEGIIRLNEQGAGLSWCTPNGVRIDTLDEDVIKLIKKSNCAELVFGLEHGDQEMLDIMNKKLNLDKAFNIIKLAVKHDIPIIKLFIIIGYPGETNERFLKSLNYLKNISKLGRNINMNYNFAQPYPGTTLLKKCLRKGYVKDKNFANFLLRKNLMDSSTVSITTPDFDTAEALRRKKLLTRLFDHSPLWKKILKKSMPKSLIDLVKSI